MPLPAAVHVKYRPFGLTFLTYFSTSYEHANGDHYQPDNQNNGKDYISKLPVIRIFMTGNKRLEEKNNYEYETVDSKDSSNNANPIGD